MARRRCPHKDDFRFDAQESDRPAGPAFDDLGSRSDKALRGVDFLIAIRHSEEAGELVKNHLGIRVSEEGTRQKSGPMTGSQRP